MSPLLTLHLLALGCWIGVVGAEFVIEIAGMKSDDALRRASHLHFATDIWVEIPAFTTVLVTGLLMINESHLSGMFLYKICFGLLAVGFNLLAVFAVFKRRSFALNDDMHGMQSVEKLMRLSALVIPSFLIALALGIVSVLN